jgi:hypothetical protein
MKFPVFVHKEDFDIWYKELMVTGDIEEVDLNADMKEIHYIGGKARYIHGGTKRIIIRSKYHEFTYQLQGDKYLLLLCQYNPYYREEKS